MRLSCKHRSLLHEPCHAGLSFRIGVGIQHQAARSAAIANGAKSSKRISISPWGVMTYLTLESAWIGQTLPRSAWELLIAVAGLSCLMNPRRRIGIRGPRSRTALRHRRAHSTYRHSYD